MILLTPTNITYHVICVFWENMHIGTAKFQLTIKLHHVTVTLSNVTCDPKSQNLHVHMMYLHVDLIDVFYIDLDYVYQIKKRPLTEIIFNLIAYPQSKYVYTLYFLKWRVREKVPLPSTVSTNSHWERQFPHWMQKMARIWRNTHPDNAAKNDPNLYWCLCFIYLYTLTLSHVVRSFHPRANNVEIIPENTMKLWWRPLYSIDKLYSQWWRNSLAMSCLSSQFQCRKIFYKTRLYFNYQYKLMPTTFPVVASSTSR